MKIFPILLSDFVTDCPRLADGRSPGPRFDEQQEAESRSNIPVYICLFVFLSANFLTNFLIADQVWFPAQVHLVRARLAFGKTT